MEELVSHWTDIHEMLCLCIFLRNCWENWSFIIIGQDQCTFLIIFQSLLLRIKNVSDKIVQKIETHILCSITFFQRLCCLWDNVENYCRIGQATYGDIIRRMRIACWIPKATNTHTGCIILIAFPLQQWLYESTSMLRYTYAACLVIHIYQLKYIVQMKRQDVIFLI